MFKVGEKVVSNSYSNSSKTIGTVIRVTQKRKDVVVDFGNYEETYNKDGKSKNNEIWFRSYIEPLTPELEKEIYDNRLIRKCIKVFENSTLNADQAKKILEILENE